VSVRPVFVRPCVPAEVARPPQDEDWIHESKFDGYRFQIVKNHREVRLFSKSGAEYGARLPGWWRPPARAAVLDGELVFFDAKARRTSASSMTKCARAGRMERNWSL